MTPAERLDELVRGANPREVTQLKSGFVVMHEWQHWPGYCLLLAYPMASNLNELTAEARLQFMSDMTDVGDAILEATDAERINYSIYGNQDPFLHAHIVPRFRAELPDQITLPPLAVPAMDRERDEDRYSQERHGDLQRKIEDHLVGAREI